MGTFRLLLAWMVVIGHTDKYQYISTIDCGLIAVSVFFFVSGYLMPLAFEANYKFSSFGLRIKNYALNRFMRIYPIYWMSLILCILLKFAFGKNLMTADLQNFFSNVSVYIQNFLLLGLNQSNLWGQYLRLNNPAWSLDIELQYYILVPFLLICWHQRQTITVIVLTIFSILSVYLLAAPVSLVDIDRSLLAWSCLFFLGFIYFQSNKLQSMLQGKLITALIVIVCGASSFFLKEEFRTVTIVAGFTFVAAHLLVLQKERRFGQFDSRLGDLSYPVYILHIYVIGNNNAMYSRFIDKLFFPVSQFVILVVANVVISTIIAYAAFLLITQPIDKFRNKYKKMSIKPGS